MPLAIETTANIWSFAVAFVTVVGSVVAAYLAYLANRSARSTREQTEQLAEVTRTNRQSGGHLGTSIDQLHDRLDVVQEGVAQLSALPGAVRRVEAQQREEHRVLGRVVDKLDAHSARIVALEMHSADRTVVDAVNFAELGSKLDAIAEPRER